LIKNNTTTAPNNLFFLLFLANHSFQRSNL
jgi:hypothetical protein